MLHRSIGAAAIAAAVGGAGAGAQTVPPANLLPTAVVIANLQDVDAITTDGEYLYIVPDANGSRNAGAWIEDMNGKRWPVPKVDRQAPLLGTETGGVFVFDHVAGSAPIAFAYKPGVGVLSRFINHRDPFALSMYDALQSSRGHWVAARTNAPGGWGPGVYQWVDVDDTPVPMLSKAEAYTWAPDGVTLGYADMSFGQGKGWLSTYNVLSHKVTILGVPFALVDRMALPSAPVALNGWQSTGFNTLAPSTAVVQWSTDGKWLAGQGQTPSELHIVGVRGGQESTVPLPKVTDFWGWTAADKIYTVNGQTISLYEYGHATATNSRLDAWNLVQRFTVHGPLTRAVSTQAGLLVGTESGTVYRVTVGSKVVAVTENAKAWWYDDANGRLYVLPTTSSGRVHSLKL